MNLNPKVTNGVVLVVKRTNEPVSIISHPYQRFFRVMDRMEGHESEPTNRERRIAMEGLEKPLSLHTPQPLYRYLKYIEI